MIHSESQQVNPGMKRHYVLYYNLDVRFGPIRSLISALGYSPLSDESGRTRSQAHFSVNWGDNSPSSIWVMYFPRTGKNLKPWNEPHVAMYRPDEAGWGEIMKSELDVKASLDYRSAGCSSIRRPASR